jgi:beta-galactosidase/beta-glucuronidase
MSLTIANRDPVAQLTDDWEFTTDPRDRGIEAEWYVPDTSWPDARGVTVPHAWQEHDDLRTYTGAAWYRRQLTVGDHPATERVILYFGAVDWQTDVWVNGKHVGENEGGYLPFTVDVTNAVEPGANTLVLRVSDPADLAEIPHGKQGDPWYTRVSGPWQSVALHTVPETRVETVRVTPSIPQDTATFDVELVGRVDAAELVVTVAFDGRTIGTEQTAVSDGGGHLSFPVPDASYWTPESPTLYDYEVTLLNDGTELDSVSGTFGMRSVTVEDGTLLLNGEPLAIRGALDQAYYPDTFYRPSGPVSFEAELRTAKELGFNLLRKHIKPAHPRFLELADRLGMLVWEEPANPTRYTDESKRRVREQLPWDMQEVGDVGRGHDLVGRHPHALPWSEFPGVDHEYPLTQGLS